MIDLYHGHVEQLCGEHEIILRIRETSPRGTAYRSPRMIAIPPIRGAVSYCVALHEIGHIIGPDQTTTPQGTALRPRLVREAGAWRWAVNNAAEWTDSMTRAMSWRLASYLQWAQRKNLRRRRNLGDAWRGQISVRIPPADHYFWNLMKGEI